MNHLATQSDNPPQEPKGGSDPRLTVDLLVIGFGKAGKTLAMKRAAAGDRVVLVEKDPSMYGGTCINIGCVPTKTLLTSAHRYRQHQPSRGSSQSAVTDSHKIREDDEAFAAAREHRNAFIAQLNTANLNMAQGKGVTVIDGQARFLDSHTVDITGGPDRLTVTGKTVVINTGSVPVKPRIHGLDDPDVGARVHDSTAIQQVDPRPRSLAILGGGPIGLEFATMFAQFGTQVTVIDGAKTFLGRYDRDIAQAAYKQLTQLGVTILSGTRAETVETEANDLRIRVEGPDGSLTVTSERLLVATGRRPATEGLGLKEAGIELTERGAVVVDEHRRSSVEGVYAAGDVNGGPQFTYVSYDDHRIILADRWGEGGYSASDRIIPATVFLDPPLSTVGMGEEEARRHTDELGHTLEIKASDIADVAIMPRPKILGQSEGRAKFLVDQNEDRILGASLFCVDSQELINLVALAMSQGIPASGVGAGIYTHPSSSEIFNALLEK
ncbi:FAD-dependent oxidoreductase [Curtobacterium sp. S6]|uniref:FAD-dependent oxidoreductase n=1 Tax=Curtobacterium sp. S6 TaxID=1479623 RepID=UPI0009EAACAB|nr:FAD-dependent oxidoreductase [Curtobacterium sp. S6]